MYCGCVETRICMSMNKSISSSSMNMICNIDRTFPHISTAHNTPGLCVVVAGGDRSMYITYTYTCTCTYMHM